MAEIPWGNPEAIERLTIVQLLCLAHERDPARGEAQERVTTFEDREALMQIRRDEWERGDA